MYMYACGSTVLTDSIMSRMKPIAKRDYMYKPLQYSAQVIAAAYIIL